MDYIYAHGGELTIPSRKGAKFDRYCDWHLYKERYLVENYFLKLKAFRRIATRYDKLAFKHALARSIYRTCYFYALFEKEKLKKMLIIRTTCLKLIYKGKAVK